MCSTPTNSRPSTPNHYNSMTLQRHLSQQGNNGYSQHGYGVSVVHKVRTFYSLLGHLGCLFDIIERL